MQIPTDLAQQRVFAAQVHSAITEILAELYELVRTKAINTENWGVNWGSLRCVCIRIGYEFSRDETEAPDLFAEASIEEVAPDDIEFAAAIRERLEARGFPYIRIQTEW